MTRKEARELVNALVTMRGSATDEMALEAAAVYPEWRSGVDYTAGERVHYNDVLYKVLQNHTSLEGWTPEAAPSLFAKVLIPGGIPAWEQPDSTNTYKKGDKVTHNGKTWESEIDYNSYEPGVYGWREIE